MLLQKVKKTVHSPFEIDICFGNSFFKEYGCCQSVGRIVTLLNLRNKTGKEEVGRPCVTNVTIILFEKTFRQTLLFVKQIFLKKTRKNYR